MTRICHTAALIFISLVFLIGGTVAALAATPVSCSSPNDAGVEPTQYFVSLADPDRHVAHVSVRIPRSDGPLVLDMPVWNALYQVRNFATNVENVRAQDTQGNAAEVYHTSTSQWLIMAPAGCVVVSYEVHLDNSGPFGAALNAEHGFFNWAMVLMYSSQLRNQPVSLHLLDLPAGWSVRDLHVLNPAATPAEATNMSGAVRNVARGIARNYDELADSPAEAGKFQLTSFQQDGATYHIVVHADPADYDIAKLQQMLQKVTHAAVDWMQDRPYDDYTFLYHFPKGPGGGGMEHAFGTAIDVSAERLKEDYAAVADVSAHEFFHLWNVKRIRPQSLEPVDYQHEQDTRALWFSEGVTSTVGNLLLVRAGLLSEQQYQSSLGRMITDLQQAPAHAWQSAEESSLDAWFEGNAFYRTPERSVSYYLKGDLLGMLLDLRLRQLTDGHKSLRDLFQWMNQHYAKRHYFFPDSAGVEEAAEAVAGTGAEGVAPANQPFVRDFFRDYVAGVKAIPYNDFFQFVGLHLLEKSQNVATAGFTTTANIGGAPEVVAVDPDSEAQRNGLIKGDRLIAMNSQPLSGPLEDEVAQLHPGDTITLTVKNRAGQRDVKIRLGARIEQYYELEDLPNVTPLQLAHRTAWMHGDDEAAP